MRFRHPLDDIGDLSTSAVGDWFDDTTADSGQGQDRLAAAVVGVERSIIPALLGRSATRIAAEGFTASCSASWISRRPHASEDDQRTKLRQGRGVLDVVQGTRRDRGQ
ncbi:hypothetical protein [Catenulispora acidiphila]|uniref:hypothetical protein n=1 Tax=Catenulispora acidiphila TaxID=304895 RepID=UPI00019DF5FA|nr:hypothetical protein [Catenulispora acidiphila]